MFEHETIKLTTKHTPATPLPWQVVENRYGKAYIVSKPVQDAAGEKATIHTGRIFALSADKKRRQTGLYALHAANAYPRLVEALLNLLHAGDMDFSNMKGKAFALLRELGEE